MTGIDTAIHQITTGSELELARPAIEALIVGLEASVHTRVFRQLNGPEELTTQDALNAWVELRAYQRMRTRLTQAVQMGQSAGIAMEPAWSDKLQESGHGEE